MKGKSLWKIKKIFTCNELSCLSNALDFGPGMVVFTLGPSYDSDNAVP